MAWGLSSPPSAGGRTLTVSCLGTSMMPTHMSQCCGVSAGSALPRTLPALLGDKNGGDKGQSWVAQRALGYLGTVPIRAAGSHEGFSTLVSKLEERPRLPLCSGVCMCARTGVCVCVCLYPHTLLPDGRGSIPLPWQLKRVPRQQDGHGDSQEGQQSPPPIPPLCHLAPRDWGRRGFGVGAPR